jgi:hypothetical protein
VRCTSDGRAKLIDFGALSPMGPSHQVIGTPAYVAPELVHGQELDGRADLYALGALLYWTLTGRPAFPARTFKQLRDVWRTRPSAPSTFAAEIPRELDALVMALLSLDPAARPSSAAEVISRLNALAQLPSDEAPAVAHAYLATPTLVGRSEEQLSFRKRMLRALRGKGGSVLIEGAPGMGRSRLLSNLVLEAKLVGATVLSASAADATGDGYGLLRALVEPLLKAAPELAHAAARAHVQVIASALPALLAGDAAVPAVASETAVREALCDWFIDMARAQPLCVAIDDLPRADALSAAFVARLSARAHEHPIVVAVSAEAGRASPLSRLVEQLSEVGARIVLAPLSEAQSAALLRSVFGEVPHLSTTAAWIHRLSGGNPGSSMELAQHLVDRGIARLVEGGWTLPQRLDALALPASFEQVLADRFGSLSECARTLAQLLSLVTPLTPLAIPDYLALLSHSHDNKQIWKALDELVRAQVLTAAGDGYALRDRTLFRVIEDSLTPSQSRTLHLQLARHLEQHLSDAEMIVVYHLRLAGEEQLAFDRLHALLPRLNNIDGFSTRFARTKLGIGLLEDMYEKARGRGVPPHQLHRWQKILVQMAAVRDPALGRYVEHMLPRLRKDSGWIYWQEYPELPPLERITRCLQRAQQVYEQTPEAERGLSPIDAIRELAIAAANVNSLSARTFDTDAVAQLPALLEPFVPLAPIVGLLHTQVVMTVDSLIRGLFTAPRRQLIIEQLKQPFAGMDELTRQGTYHILTYYKAIDETMRSEPTALRSADELEMQPSYEPLAWQVRMLYYQNEGDIPAAERARQQRDLRAMLQVDCDMHLTRSLTNELLIAERTFDLIAVKRLLDRLAAEAERFAGWRPWHAYGLAVYDALRGDAAAALRAVEHCLALMPAAGHPVRFVATPLRIELLTSLGESERAFTLAREMLAEAEAHGLEVRDPVPMMVAMARLETLHGQYGQGVARLERLIEARTATGPGGLELGVLYEQRARLALIAGDREGFERFATGAAERLGRHRHPALLGRLQQLIADARVAEQPISPELARSADAGPTMTSALSSVGNSVYTVLGACRGSEDRARRALDLLVREAEAAGGYLFGVAAGGLQLLASKHVPAIDVTLERAVAAHMQAILREDDHDDATRVDGPAAPDVDSTHLELGGVLGPETTEAVTVTELRHKGHRLRPFMLRSVEGANIRLGGVVLLTGSDERELHVSWEMLNAVSHALLQAGDVVAAVG